MSEQNKFSIHSVDAKDWAIEFKNTVENNPKIATDLETLMTWFANAIMAGYDYAAKEGRATNNVRIMVDKFEKGKPSVCNEIEEGL